MNSQDQINQYYSHVNGAGVGGRNSSLDIKGNSYKSKPIRIERN